MAIVVIVRTPGPPPNRSGGATRLVPVRGTFRTRVLSSGRESRLTPQRHPLLYWKYRLPRTGPGGWVLSPSFARHRRPECFAAVRSAVFPAPCATAREAPSANGD